jgi:hypothetical protein
MGSGWHDTEGEIGDLVDEGSDRATRLTLSTTAFQ